jgi:hypothetical protein
MMEFCKDGILAVEMEKYNLFFLYYKPILPIFQYFNIPMA